MFSLLKKIYPTKKINHKKNTSLIIDDNSNPNFFNFFGGENISETPKDKSFEKKNNQKCCGQDCNRNEFLNTFAKTIITTILDSRKDSKNNIINLSNNSNNDTSFSIDIDELFIYNDLYEVKNDFQKYSIEFYLIKNKGNKKINELVEKWKFYYQLKDNEDIRNDTYDINYLKNKITILKKSIITYSKLFPLNEYIQKKEDAKDYSIDFKFYNDTPKKKGVFRSPPSGKVSLKNSDLFSFKMNIKYYSKKEIKQIFNEIEDNNDFLDLDLDKNVKKIKSLSFHKSRPILDGFELIENPKNDNNPININKKNDLSKINLHPLEINNKINEINTLSESSNSSFTLNIYDFNGENNNNINSLSDRKAKDKNEDNIFKDNNLCKRKYSLFSNSYETTEDCTPRNSGVKPNENKEIKISPYLITNKKNNKINNIIKEYIFLKDMMNELPNFSNIKTNKMITYTDIFE